MGEMMSSSELTAPIPSSNFCSGLIIISVLSKAKPCKTKRVLKGVYYIDLEGFLQLVGNHLGGLLKGNTSNKIGRDMSGLPFPIPRPIMIHRLYLVSTRFISDLGRTVQL